MPLRALLVSYAFPPTGGAGVARVSKLAKYLPAHDVRPAVLTVRNPSVPLVDESRVRDLPPDLEIERVPTLEPGYGWKQKSWSTNTAPAGKKSRFAGLAAAGRSLLLPDPQVLWQPAAQAALARRMVAGRDDLVFISAPPFSQFLSAPLLRLRPGQAVVLDYRDEWSTTRSTYEMIGGSVPRLAGEAMERLVVRSAHVITTATEAFRDNLLRTFPFLRPERVIAIPNGYDRDDLPAELPPLPRDRLILTYAGTIFRLTSARALLGAVRRLHARAPELARLLRVRFLGRIVDTELPPFEGTEALGVERLGYVPHEQVVSELAASHVTLCLLDDVPGAERIYPAKIFELMALRRPCLTLAPPGALAELVRQHRVGPVLPPRDEEAIAAELERLLRELRDRGAVAAPDPTGIERYDRRALAGEFADAFRRAVGHATAGGSSS